MQSTTHVATHICSPKASYNTCPSYKESATFCGQVNIYMEVKINQILEDMLIFLNQLHINKKDFSFVLHFYK